MSKVSPFHSSNPADPDVWHDEDTCPPGRQIPPRNRVLGKGEGNRKCKLPTANREAASQEAPGRRIPLSS